MFLLYKLCIHKKTVCGICNILVVWIIQLQFSLQSGLTLYWRWLLLIYCWACRNEIHHYTAFNSAYQEYSLACKFYKKWILAQIFQAINHLVDYGYIQVFINKIYNYQILCYHRNWHFCGQNASIIFGLCLSAWMLTAVKCSKWLYQTNKQVIKRLSMKCYSQNVDLIQNYSIIF